MSKSLFKIPLVVFIVVILVSAASFILPSAPAQADESSSKCWAVFAAVADYKNVNDLPYPVQDSTALYNLFGPVWGEDNMQLLANSQATKVNILHAIDWLAENAGVNDTVFFSFAGHGTEGGYLCPYETNSFPSSWISSDELAEALAEVQAQRIVVVLSNCYAGAFKPDLTKDGRVVLMGCRATEVGWESTNLGHVVFLHFILQAFENFTDADANHDYELSAEEIFNYAAPLVVQYETDHLFDPVQHPVLGDGFINELALLARFVFNLQTNLPSGTQVLTVDGTGYTTAPPYLWWIPGSSHTVTVPEEVAAGTGTRYAFAGWNDGETSTTRILSKGSFSVSYYMERLLNIISAYDEPVGAGWYLDRSYADISVNPYIESADTRRIFTGWSGDLSGTSATASLFMDAPKTVTANWRSEYLLTLNSEYGQPVGAGWYDELDSVNVSVEPVQGFIVRQIFDGWSGDLTSNDSRTTVTMNVPKTLTANWHTDYLQLYILIVVVVVIAGGVILTVVLVRRNRNAGF